MRYEKIIIDKARSLRQAGKTYSEIQSLLSIEVPHPTLSYWFKGIIFSAEQNTRLQKIIAKNIRIQRLKALKVNRDRRTEYLNSLRANNLPLKSLVSRAEIAKITLAVLYLAEGSKRRRGALTFCNSDPGIIRFFLNLLRRTYKPNLQKFRCTVQCRADQDVVKLTSFWHKLTGIDENLFYSPRVDLRTANKPTKQLEYRGVLRIDYFDAKVYNELQVIGEILTGK